MIHSWLQPWQHRMSVGARSHCSQIRCRSCTRVLKLRPYVKIWEWLFQSQNISTVSELEPRRAAYLFARITSLADEQLIRPATKRRGPCAGGEAARNLLLWILDGLCFNSLASSAVSLISPKNALFTSGVIQGGRRYRFAAGLT